MVKNSSACDPDHLRVLIGREFTLDNRNGKAALLLHGMMGGPLQLRELGDALHSCGYHVRGMRLPGHGHDLRSLGKVTADEWKRSVLHEYALLRQNFAQVDLLGFSLGGLLSLYIAQHYTVPNLCLFGVPIYITRSYLPVAQTVRKLHQWFTHLPTLQIKWRIPGDNGETIDLPLPFERKIPLHLIREVLDLANEIRPAVKRSKASRALIVHSRADIAASPESSDYLQHELNCPHKRQFWLRFAHHEIFFTQYKDSVIRTTLDFLNEHKTQ